MVEQVTEEAAEVFAFPSEIIELAKGVVYVAFQNVPAEGYDAGLRREPEQAPLANSEGLARILEVFTDTEVRLKEATSKKILVEVALQKAVEARNATSLDTILRELNNLRSGGSSAGGPM